VETGIEAGLVIVVLDVVGVVVVRLVVVVFAGRVKRGGYSLTTKFQLVQEKWKLVFFKRVL
jgi:hypothetical protein